MVNEVIDDIPKFGMIVDVDKFPCSLTIDEMTTFLSSIKIIERNKPKVKVATLLEKVEKNYYTYKYKCIEHFIFGSSFLLELIRNDVDILNNEKVRLHILNLFNTNQIDILFDKRESKQGYYIMPGISYSCYLEDDELKEQFNQLPIEFLTQTYYKFL